MLYSVTQRSISFSYSISIFSINMPQDESLKKVQSNSISLNVAIYGVDVGGEGDAVVRGWHLPQKCTLLGWYDAASCVNCQRPWSILPPLLELCVALLELWMFSMTCGLRHSLRGKGIHVELGTFFSSLMTILCKKNTYIKCIMENGLLEGGWFCLLWKYSGLEYTHLVKLSNVRAWLSCWKTINWKRFCQSNPIVLFVSVSAKWFNAW